MNDGKYNEIVENEREDGCVKIVEFRSELHPALVHREVGQNIPVPSEGDGVELGNISGGKLEIDGTYEVAQRTFTYFENGIDEVNADKVVRITVFVRESGK